MKRYASAFGDVLLASDQHALGSILSDLKPSSTFVICDTNTASACLPKIESIEGDIAQIIIPHGEENKSLAQCEFIWSTLIAHHADRHSLILNLGGGMVGDLGGFAASCFQRGIRFMQLPTSVIAMTDASIGGKLGVDFGHYKNYVGLFNSPALTWIWPGFLQTLPEVEIRGGIAEVIKHAVIGSRELWDVLQQTASPGEMNWERILEYSIAVKLAVVNADPYELGARKTLNFGHTIGHALESYFLRSGQPVSHGVAVAYGMMAEAWMSLDLGMFPKESFDELLACIGRLVNPPLLPIPDARELMVWMTRDKKNLAQQLSFSLPEAIGHCRWDIRVGNIVAAIEWLREHVVTYSLR